MRWIRALIGIASILLATGAMAASLTLTSVGLISSGTDEAGIFGTVGDLAGKSYSLSMRLEPFNTGIQQYAPSAYESTVFSDFNIVSGDPVHSLRVLSFSATVADNVYSLVLDSASYKVVLSDFLSHGVGGGLPDQIYGTFSGSNFHEEQDVLMWIEAISRVTPFLSSVSFQDRTVDYSFAAGDEGNEGFQTSGKAGHAVFNGMSQRVSLTIEGVGADFPPPIPRSPIPEPSTVLLLAIGLGVLAAIESGTTSSRKHLSWRIACQTTRPSADHRIAAK